MTVVGVILFFLRFLLSACVRQDVASGHKMFTMSAPRLLNTVERKPQLCLELTQKPRGEKSNLYQLCFALCFLTC